jgi:hypothetical protein
MEPTRIRPGLYRWTAPHPDYEPDPEPGSPADWPKQVGCVAYEAAEALVLVDPLVPDELWPALDRLAEGRPVVVLTTIGFHRRSRQTVVERYGASTSRAKGNLPRGVEAISIPRAGEHSCLQLARASRRVQRLAPRARPAHRDRGARRVIDYQYRPLPPYPVKWANWDGLTALSVGVLVLAWLYTRRRAALLNAERVFIEEDAAPATSPS